MIKAVDITSKEQKACWHKHLSTQTKCLSNVCVIAIVIGKPPYEQI